MIKYSIWLQLILGAGSNKINRLFELYSSARKIFETPKEELVKSKLFSKAELSRMEKFSLADSLKILSDCNLNGIKTVAFGEASYPYCLSVIENPPLVLYYKGDLPDFDNVPTVAIVGPRKVSEFGKKAAYSLAFRLAGAGFQIVSGGALGTDTYAHAGTLKAFGKTVLVTGCGLLSEYLPENKALRNEIENKGCLMSEFPPKTEPTKFTFPVRNRIISALSLGTVVVEAGIKSGALITARHSYEQGREVFVIPGSPDKKEYAGSNALLRDGAKPLLDASDIFNEYIPRFADKINIDRAYERPIIDKISEKVEKIEKNFYKTLSKEAKIVYNHLDKQKFLPDEIINTGLSDGEILSALTELEMELLIKALPGGLYEKL